MKNGNVLKFVKDYWFILFFIVSIAIGWTNLQSSVEANRLKNDQQSIDIRQLASTLNVLDKTYIQDITFIKTTLQLLKETQ